MTQHSTDVPERPASAAPPAAPPRRRRRWAVPLVIVAVGALAIAATWLLPLGDTPELFLVMTSYGLFLLTLFLLVGWLLLTPGSRLATALTLLGVAVLTVALFEVEETRWYGDMVPIPRFRWSRSHDDVVEQHRRDQQGTAPAAVLGAPEAAATDCPAYRGRHRDGVAQGPTLSANWGAGGPKPLWRQPVGAGHSSFAVAGNLAITLEQRRDQETVVCYDTETGRERWVHSYKAKFVEALGGKGPRSTPAIAGDEVYALGATGQLVCLDARTGASKWKEPVNVLADNDNVTWGMSGSPLVYKDWVLVNPGAQKASAPGTLHAYRRDTGKLAWTAGRAHAGYSSPMVARLDGREQVVLFDGNGVSGYDPEDNGKELWRYPWETNQQINSAQPLALGEDRLFLSSAYGVGCAVLEVKQKDGQWRAEPVWTPAVKNALRCKFNSPVLWDGYVYGLDEKFLVCVDPKTGERRWREGRFGHGQLLVTNGTLVVLGEDGELALVEASPKGYRELGRFQALEGRTWNVPALVNGRAYVRNDQEMACYDLTGR